MKFPFKVVIIVLERWKNVIKSASFNYLKYYVTLYVCHSDGRWQKKVEGQGLLEHWGGERVSRWCVAKEFLNCLC